MSESSTLGTSSGSSNFEAIFNAALAKYSEQTNMDLRNHPLASKIEACDSAESVLALFQEQAKAFDEFRNGDPRLIKWLQPVVNGLYTISTSPTITTSVGLVSLSKCFCFLTVLSNAVIVQSFPPASAVFSGISVLLSVRIYPCSPLTLLIAGIPRSHSL
jgi:hypothetical protein